MSACEPRFFAALIARLLLSSAASRRCCVGPVALRVCWRICAALRLVSSLVTAVWRQPAPQRQSRGHRSAEQLSTRSVHAPAADHCGCSPCRLHPIAASSSPLSTATADRSALLNQSHVQQQAQQADTEMHRSIEQAMSCGEPSESEQEQPTRRCSNSAQRHCGSAERTSAASAASLSLDCCSFPSVLSPAPLPALSSRAVSSRVLSPPLQLARCLGPSPPALRQAPAHCPRRLVRRLIAGCVTSAARCICLCQGQDKRRDRC